MRVHLIDGTYELFRMYYGAPRGQRSGWHRGGGHARAAAQLAVAEAEHEAEGLAPEPHTDTSRA